MNSPATPANETVDSIMATYTRLPVTFARGNGIRLEDTDGKSYLDALSGIAVCGLGHAHPEVASAIADQAKTLLHTSNLYGIDLQQQVADKLTTLSGMDSVFFSNSGAEANEAAIKIARKYGHRRNIDEPVIVVMEQSFHGRTMATLSASGNPKVQDGFAPLVSGFVHVPYGNADAVAAAIADNSSIVAVMVEPIQGESGVHIPPASYLPALRALCDQHDLLLILDEIQTGMARTGKWFASQHPNVMPDVMTLAKALGNGVPIGACLARGTAASMLGFGNHGSTFGGNPLACRAALSVIDIIARDDLANHATDMGDLICNGFSDALSDLDLLREIRHRGLMIGIELGVNATDLVKLALEAGLLINVCSDTIIRLLPPLIISPQEAEELVTRLSDVIHAWAKTL
jgi:acetylornithine aminotransferase